MPTVEDVARHVAGITNSNDDILLIGDWASYRWQEVVTHAGGTLRALRRLGELYIEPTYSTGTVAATQGERTLTGTDTVWTTQMVGRFLRIINTWQRIEQVLSETSLLLEKPYPNVDVSGAGYTIADRRHKLAPTARKLGVFVHDRLMTPLEIVSETGLELAFPGARNVNSVPQYVAEVEPDENNVRQVEIYPFSNRRELIHYIYWDAPQRLSFKDTFPGFVDTEALREGVLIDVYRNKMVKAMDAGNAEAAALWRNEYRAQETQWKNTHRTRVLSQDVGVDDLEFILERRPAHPGYKRETIINDAYSHIWYR